jgi:hypothetical protein
MATKSMSDGVFFTPGHGISGSILEEVHWWPSFFYSRRGSFVFVWEM